LILEDWVGLGISKTGGTMYEKGEDDTETYDNRNASGTFA
jgi:hypothetical protein